MKVSEINFRNVYHKICFIVTPNRLLKNIASDFEHDDECNGILVYGYIDHHVGLTFELLARGKCLDNKISWFAGNDSISSKFRYSSVADCDIYIFNNQPNLSKDFSRKISNIDKYYKATEGIESLRLEIILDSSRNNGFPDDILVYLVSETKQPEGCWVRCEEITDGRIFGTLLNEPNQDFKVHRGDIIGITIQKTDNGFVCLHIE